MTTKLKNESLWSGIWCSYSIPGCACFQNSSSWTGPYLVTQLFPHGAVELETKKGVRFKVNGQHIKIYFGHAESVNEVIEAYYLDEVLVTSALSRAAT